MPRPDRLGLAGLLSGAVGLACFALTALLGPSAMEPALPGGPRQPPYSLVARPPAHLVIGLTAAGVVLAALGLGLCLGAVRRGWWIRPRILLLAGGIVAVAFMFMPPVGSADHLNYAAYGRMAITGNDPYVTAARDLPIDPVAAAVQDWRNVPTVYGPIATAQESFASLIGGSSVRLTVFVMSVTNVVAFLAAGLLLSRATRGDPGRELRAALLWTANPLLLFELVGGAHNDVIAIGFAIAGLVVFALPDPVRARGADGRPLSRCLAAGILIGAGAAVKINVAIVAAGPLWVLAREWWRHRRAAGPRPEAAGRRGGARLVVLAAGVVAVTGLAYAMAGPHSLDQLHRASKSVSLATPWHLFAGSTGGLLTTVSRSLVQTGAVLLTAALAASLLHALPTPATGGLRPADLVGGQAARITAALALAWLFAAPYALPWYDGLGWAVIALVPWSRFDRLLMIHTAVLSVAYLPARDPRIAGVPPDLHWLVVGLRARVTPVALTLLLMVLAATAFRSRRVPALGRSPRAPAEPRS